MITLFFSYQEENNLSIKNIASIFALTLSISTVHANLIQPSELQVDKGHISNTALSRDFVQKNSVEENIAESDVLDRLSSVAVKTVRNFSQIGIASWYGRQFKTKPATVVDRFELEDLTASHKSLPLDCLIRVTNQDNGKSVIVKVNERKPFSSNRVVDLSYGAAKLLGILEKGSTKVSIERIEH